MTISINTFFEDTQPDIQAVKVDADNEAINGTGVDMLGYQGVVFFATAGKGEIGAFELKAQQDSASNFGTAADLLGSAKAFSTAVGTDGFAFLEIAKPDKRYVRPVLTAPDLVTARPVSVIAIRYGKNWHPETNSDGELQVSPAEGQA